MWISDFVFKKIYSNKINCVAGFKKKHCYIDLELQDAKMKRFGNRIREYMVAVGGLGTHFNF